MNGKAEIECTHRHTLGGGLPHTVFQLTAWLKMCPKMTPHPKVFVCTYYGGERGSQTRQQAAAGSRRREEQGDAVAVLFKSKDPRTCEVGNNDSNYYYTEEMPTLYLEGYVNLRMTTVGDCMIAYV